MDNDRKDRIARLESASIDAAHQGIKALLILNGGASVALLGFVANVFSLDMDTGRARLFDGALSSLVFFAIGAGLSVIVSLIAYITNRAYVSALYETDHVRINSSWMRAGFWNKVTIIIVILSLFAFGAGVYTIWAAIS